MSDSVAVDNADPKDSAETSSAQDDLDSLLNEFESSTGQTDSQKSEGGQTEDVSALASKVNELDQFIANQQYQTDMQSVVKTIKGDIEAPFVDDSFVETWVNAQANQNPKLAQAWVNRHTNPQAFQKVVGSLSKAFQEKFNVDQKATSDLDSVSAAVRSASTKSPEPETPVDWSSMSDAEFAAAKAALKRKRG